jgi:hypothetical protein
MEIDIHLLNWLLEKGMPYPNNLNEVVTTGSGPFEENQFDDLVRSLGIQIFNPNKEIETLVLGRENWSEQLINEVLDDRSGLQLRAYSQEMYLAYLISGVDPLEEDEEQVRLLAGEHSALNFLEAVGFQWPTTQVPTRGGGNFVANLLNLGLLGFKGYTVKVGGPSTTARQRILVGVYTNPVPNEFPAYYIRQWGIPGSSKRLNKMANTIATLCKNYKRRSNPLSSTIAKWESDLAWLKANYYDGHYRFEWPSTDVW